MTTVTSQKCACTDCVCVVAVADAVKKDGRNYCSDACADGHRSSAGCGHEGCSCRG